VPLHFFPDILDQPCTIKSTEKKSANAEINFEMLVVFNSNSSNSALNIYKWDASRYTGNVDDIYIIRYYAFCIFLFSDV
jgi:hypothetical protein